MINTLFPGMQQLFNCSFCLCFAFFSRNCLCLLVVDVGARFFIVEILVFDFQLSTKDFLTITSLTEMIVIHKLFFRDQTYLYNDLLYNIKLHYILYFVLSLNDNILL